MATRKKVWELPGHTLDVSWRNSVAFSQDGSLFALATEEGEIQIWNPREKKQVRALAGSAQGKRSRILGFAKNDTQLFSMNYDGTIRIWDLVNGEMREILKEEFGRKVAVAPDAATIAYGDGMTVKFWDIKAQKQRLPTAGHDWAVRWIDFAPDGKTLASCSYDDTVRIWDIERRTEIRQWRTGKNNPAWQVRFSKDGKALITANWESVELRDFSTGKLKSVFGDKKWNGLDEVRLLPDRKTVVSVEGKNIYVLSLDEKRVIRSFPAPLKGNYRSTITPDGLLVASTGEKGIALVDTTTGKSHVIEPEGRPETMVFSPNGRYLVWPERNAIVVRDWNQVGVGRRIKSRGFVRTLAFDRTGRYLATAGLDSKIRIWDLKNADCIGEFTHVGGEIHCLAFSPTEELLGSADDDGAIILWDLRKKALPPPLPSTEELLRKLLAATRLYGLPLPPAAAKLVVLDRGQNGKSLELLIEPARRKDKKAVFWSFHDSAESELKFQFIDPTAAALRDDPPLWTDALAAAIHCKSLGWDAMAKAVFETNNEVFPDAVEAELAANAWSFWSNKLPDPDANWPEIARRLRAIVNDRPKEFEGYDEQFVHSLETSLTPSKAKAGSLEAMVDALIEMRGNKNPLGQPAKQVDSPYRKLALRGFEAVPTLIECLEDDRFTRTYRQGLNNFRGYQYRIHDFATDLLQELAGSDLGAWRLRGDILDKATALAWWEEAKKDGEETYFRTHVLGDKESREPKMLMLEIIAQKYEKNLPQIYRTMLADRPKMDGSAVLHAISISSLPAEQKRTLFRLGVEHENATHRRVSLEYLKKLDHP